MDQDNSKILSLSFVLVAGTVWLTIGIIFEALAGTFGSFAAFWSQDLVKHGIPLFFGLSTFAFLQFKPSIRIWADEVVTEVRKVVWPSPKDTRAMTMVCCVMLIMAGVTLGIFDFVSGKFVGWLLN